MVLVSKLSARERHYLGNQWKRHLPGLIIGVLTRHVAK
jgi:hypothetical protein